MKIVIDIPEDIYNEIKEGLYDKNLRKMAIAIGNGTPIPNGHGRLIDESKIDWLTDNSGEKFTFEKRIKNTTPTIIEVDKESE